MLAQPCSIARGPAHSAPNPEFPSAKVLPGRPSRRPDYYTSAKYAVLKRPPRPRFHWPDSRAHRLSATLSRPTQSSPFEAVSIRLLPAIVGKPCCSRAPQPGESAAARPLASQGRCNAARRFLRFFPASPPFPPLSRGRSPRKGTMNSRLSTGFLNPHAIIFTLGVPVACLTSGNGITIFMSVD